MYGRVAKIQCIVIPVQASFLLYTHWDCVLLSIGMHCPFIRKIHKAVSVIVCRPT